MSVRIVLMAAIKFSFTAEHRQQRDDVLALVERATIRDDLDEVRIVALVMHYVTIVNLLSELTAALYAIDRGMSFPPPRFAIAHLQSRFDEARSQRDDVIAALRGEGPA